MSKNVKKINVAVYCRVCIEVMIYMNYLHAQGLSLQSVSSASCAFI